MINNNYVTICITFPLGIVNTSISEIDVGQHQEFFSCKSHRNRDFKTILSISIKVL